MAQTMARRSHWAAGFRVSLVRQRRYEALMANSNDPTFVLRWCELRRKAR